jgi:uncharacterized membrane protein YqjE
MAITDSIARFGTSLLETLRTRLELASVEIEEEFGRYANYVLLSIIGLFCGFVTLLLLILLVLILYWDTHRVVALLSLIALFASATVAILVSIKRALKNKPRLLAASLNELEIDIQSLRQRSQAEPEQGA